MNAAPALTAEPLFPPPPGAMTPPPAPRKNRSSFRRSKKNSSEVENINFAAKYICSPSAPSTPCLEEWEDVEMEDGSNYSLL
ncbi:uncharacterized protein RCO7_03745 [Rhynchosporium graminicola]|uniref:Uncharacterized protein n=1 Tax=Rhynchosporium graminicola TaxID=2792576 RepID=A0A1E1LGL8_9HELO|nr:uncharacterized protein RCO7_03745 [Rhynchosporium commune]